MARVTKPTATKAAATSKAAATPKAAATYKAAATSRVAAKAPAKATARTRSTAVRAKAPETIGVGIIGSGGIARGVHIPGYQKLDNVKVVAVSDPFEGARTAAAEQFGIENVYADFREMLSRDDIHVVSVTTPNFLHAEATIAALEAGKHVLCEKPLAMNASEGEAMVAAAERTGNKLMCGFHFRFTPQIQCLKRFADAGEFGNMYHARSTAMRRRGIPGWGMFIDKEKNGGGPLIDIGVHILDATMHVLGFPKPVAVSGKTYQMFGKRKDVLGLMGQWDYKKFTVEDFATALIRFEDGSTLSLESSFVANMEANEKMSFSIYGDKGGASYNPLGMYTERQQTLLDITPAYLPTGVQPHHAQIASFIDSVAKDKPVFTPGYQALEITRIIDAIYESSERNAEVTL